MQILSRRGFILSNLTTAHHADGTATLTADVHGDARWHDTIPHLLSRLVDVVRVETEADNV